MKFFKSAIIIAIPILAFFSCQKEINFDNNGVSVGLLKKDIAGDCLPVIVNGNFKKDSVLTNANYVDVQVTVSSPGTFDIRSDTVNGYSFSKAGSVVFGINTIRLYASGKAIAPGTNTFTIKYGASTCSFDVTVTGSAGTSEYTIDGAPLTCTGVTAAGTYTVGTPLDFTNTLTIRVNVTKLGTYGFGATSTSGFGFAANGTFSTLGLQNVTLNGSGTPLTAGSSAITISNFASTCTYAIPVLAGSGGGGGGSSNYFQFNDGANLIAADTGTVVALLISSGGVVALSVNAFSVTGDSAFSIAVSTTGNTQSGVNYNTSVLGLPMTMFNVLSTTNGQVYQADFSTVGQNIVVKFDVIDIVNKIVSGTFSGTAKGLTGTKTITNGKFRATLQ
jgi:hypothetical protein